MASPPHSAASNRRPFSLKKISSSGSTAADPSVEPKTEQSEVPHRDHRTPFHNYRGQRTRWIKPEGESNRRGVDPLKFLWLCFRSSNKVSMCVNVLWPVVPAAIAVHFARPDWHLAIFVLNYIAMVPAANLIGYAGQELARKLPKVFGVILETTLGSIVELIFFIVLIAQGRSYVRVVQAAILGSILANLLLCLGLCFFVGGLIRTEQTFQAAVSEVGSGLMLVAGMGLVIPAAFAASINPTSTNEQRLDDHRVTKISRGSAVMLLFAFIIYIVFQMRSHHGLYDHIFEQDEERDRDREEDLKKDKLTFTECMLALAVALTCVSMIAVFLVLEIEWLVVNRHVSDAFVGLILVPLVEKAAEHLTAVDEAYDNQMNFALAHVLGSSIQTALMNAPIVVIVGWGLGYEMNFAFSTFDSVVLILAILVVGNFLRDGKSNYLEGSLCVIVYIMIAVSAYYYPNPPESEAESGGEATSSSEGATESVATEAARLAVRTLAAAAGVQL